jgi:hypothetical protein
LRANTRYESPIAPIARNLKRMFEVAHVSSLVKCPRLPLPISCNAHFINTQNALIASQYFILETSPFSLFSSSCSSPRFFCTATRSVLFCLYFSLFFFISATVDLGTLNFSLARRMLNPLSRTSNSLHSSVIVDYIPRWEVFHSCQELR